MSLKLVPLDCPSCGSALHGDRLDTIFFCDHCGDAGVLGEGGLEMIESTALLPAPGRHATTWRPGWLLDTEVKVGDRVRADGRQTQGWQGERTFVVPAFSTPLHDLMRLARALSEAAGSTGEVPREPVRGGTLDLQDAVTLVRHLLVGDEVRRSDTLATVTVEVEVTSSRLAALPFEATQTGLRCAVTGLSVHAED